MELASDAGIATGIVTTSSITDATPASFVAHISHRLCQGPESMQRNNERFPQFSFDCHVDRRSNGGPGSIAEQIARSKLDIILGGGSRFFDQLVEGNADKSVFSTARANGFTTISSMSELATVPQAARILGLFAEETMPVRLIGEAGAVATYLLRGTRARCKCQSHLSVCRTQRSTVLPTLAEMMRAAIDQS